MATEINAQTNTFSGGMDLDTDISMLQSNKYRYAENIRLLSDINGLSGTAQNIEDICKYVLDDDIANNKDISILGVATGKAYNYNDKYTNIAWVLTKQTIDGEVHNEIKEISEFDSNTLFVASLYKGKWNITNEVQMVVNYERENICKLYITDGEGSIKVFDVADSYNNVNDDIQQYELIPCCLLSPFQLVEMVDGALPACQIQYCYQLFNQHGKESTTSSLSPKIPIVPSFQDTDDLNGYESEAISNRGCKLKAHIYNPNKLMQYIRIYSIQYINSTDTPKIYIINESKLPQTSENIDFYYIDNGQNFVSQITIEEFNDLIPFDFIAQTIAKKDNILFAGNIEEKTWDVDFDARAYRCNKNGIIKLQSSEETATMEFSTEDLFNGNVVVPEDHDCINPINIQIVCPQEDSENYSFFKEKNNYYFGGKGLNVKYEFVQLNLLGSDINCTKTGNTTELAYNIKNNITTTTSEIKGRVESDKTEVTIKFEEDDVIPSYADPKVSAQILSYQRDEIYRYGIIFYNNKNITTPVHWIGDIRFPSSDTWIDSKKSFNPFTFNSSLENVSSDTLDSIGKELIARPLGLRFTISNIPEEAEAFEIVRCRRTVSDRTVVAHGALSKTCNFHGWKNDEIDYTWSGGANDIRPYMFPNFAYKPRIAKSGDDLEGSGYVYSRVNHEFNPVNNDIYQLITAEQCFNKDEEIVKSGYYVVPIYCASHNTNMLSGRDFVNYWGQNQGSLLGFGAKLVGRAGIQFNVNDSGANNARFNYFGQIVAQKDDIGDLSKITKENADGFAIIDGPDTYGYPEQYGEWYIPAGVIKFYKTYDKKYANKFYSTKKGFYNIANAMIPTNINPTIINLQANEITNTFIDYIGEYGYRNITVGGTHHCGLAGVSTILNCPTLHDAYPGIFDENTTQMWADNAYGMGTVLMVNIKKPSTNQYGGNTYSARQNSIYQINCGYVKSSENNPVLCFNGDTYLGVLDYTHSQLFYPNDLTNDLYKMNRCFVQAYIPLESSINVYYRNDSHFMQSTKPGTQIGIGGTGEAGYMNDPGINTLYTQEKPMYSYNAAYSNTMGGKSYVQKKMFDTDDDIIFNRISCSEPKTNGEITDSWTKFKFANYIDVDNQYGPITNLKVFNNKLYFLQHEAVGIASINDRSLITDNNTSELVLGTGGILTRYDYVTVLNGDSKVRDRSITNSNSTLYWYDLDKNVLCALNNSIIELSKIKSVQSALNTLPVNQRGDVTSMFDPKYNEIWFRINDKTMIFNEQLNCFTSYYTHRPEWALPFSDYLATIQDNNIYYIHNQYDLESDEKEDKTAKLIFIINDNYANTKVYDNVWFDADFNDSDNVVSSVIFYTKTQKTKSISQKDIENREDTYRFYIPREYKEQQTSTYKSYAGRMRGKYMICEYTFDCNNKEMKIPYVKTTYRYSML